MNSPSSHINKKGAAFTLIELLCTIGVIVVLAALLLPATRSVLAMGDNAGCISNLRQMGLAIRNYCNDHADTLPGPVYTAVTSTYVLPDTYLTGFLAEYLGGEPSSSTPRVLKAALCPAYKRDVPASTWPQGWAYYSVYALMKEDSSGPIYDGSGQLISPWGRRGGAGINAQPVKLNTLSAHCNLSKTWAIQDADGVNYGAGAPVGAGVAKKPVHGGHWNQLYFDFHVGAVPVP